MVVSKRNMYVGIVKSFQAFMEQDKLFSNVIMFLPFPVEVYAPDGTTLFINKAMKDEYHLSDPVGELSNNITG